MAELAALDARVAHARNALAAVRERAARLALDRARVRARIALVQRDAQTAERGLAARVHALYVTSDVEPVAVVLGATSLDEALVALDGLTFAADRDRAIVDQLAATRSSLRRLRRKLDARARALRRTEAAVAATAAAVAAARDEREAFVADIAARRRLTAAQIDALERRARVEAAAAPLGAPASARGTSERRARPSDASTLTVVASGYSLRGVTATGAAVGWGIVAVDPAVIPLGARVWVPGYGEGIAADVGGAVRGAEIDLWFPSIAQALAWGRRSVVITVRYETAPEGPG